MMWGIVLPEDRVNAKRRMKEFDLTGPDDLEKRMQIMTEIFGKEMKALMGAGLSISILKNSSLIIFVILVICTNISQTK